LKEAYEPSHVSSNSVPPKGVLLQHLVLN